VETGRWHCHRCGAGGLLREKWPRRESRFNAKRASSRRAFALTRSPETLTVRAFSTPGPSQQDRWRGLKQHRPLARILELHTWLRVEFRVKWLRPRVFAICRDGHTGVARLPVIGFSVNGQWVLPSGGHEISPLTVSRPA
jgi:hypothetical protein